MKRRERAAYRRAVAHIALALEAHDDPLERYFTSKAIRPDELSDWDRHLIELIDVATEVTAVTLNRKQEEVMARVRRRFEQTALKKLRET